MKKLLLIALIIGCSNDDIWTIKKREFKKMDSYNYSEYISGELDSNEQISKPVQEIVQTSEKPLMENKRENPPDSFLSRAWAEIKSFLRNLFK